MKKNTSISAIHKALSNLIFQRLPKNEEADALLKLHFEYLHRCETIDNIITLNHAFNIAMSDPSEFAFEEMPDSNAKRYVSRKESGSYYSPDSLVRFMVQSCIIAPLEHLNHEDALNRLFHLKILDPAMGTGAFLLRAFAAMLDFACKHNAYLEFPYSNDQLRRNIAACLYGIDLNPKAVLLVQQTFHHLLPGAPQEIQHFVCGNAIASPLRCHYENAINHAPIEHISHLPWTIDELHHWFKLANWHEIPEDFDTTGAFHPFTIENTFCDVFSSPRGGFDIVLMNPPWNKLVISEKQFFGASLDRRCYPTLKQRNEIIQNLSLKYHAEWKNYRTHALEIKKRILSTSARLICQLPQQTNGHTDAYAMFLERAWLLLHEHGTLGAILPNAFYANHGATADRVLLFNRSAPDFLFGFNNRAALFPAVSRALRFCLFKATKTDSPSIYQTVETGFGFSTIDELIQSRQKGLTRHDTIANALGTHGEIVAEANESYHVYPNAMSFADEMAQHNIDLGQEVNVTLLNTYMIPVNNVTASADDARREPLRTSIQQRGYLVLHEKGSFAAYDATIKPNVRYVFHAAKYKQDHGSIKLDASHHYRIACRSTIHATENDKSVFALLAPNCVVGNSALVELHPQNRMLKDALVLMAVANTQFINRIAKTLVSTNLKLFVLKSLPFPKLTADERNQLAIRALRISQPAELFIPLFKMFQTTPVQNDDERLVIKNEIENMVIRAFQRHEDASQHEI